MRPFTEHSVAISSPSHAVARLVENAARDVAYAVRTLRRSAGFTAVAVLVLAVGIGANITIFRFVSALLLQPPPVMANFDAGGRATIRVPIKLPPEPWLLVEARFSEEDAMPWDDAPGLTRK